ncbi:MAG: amidase [Deltaproteobacteria bacterium]|nr:amidase [Deltaproteobacteria bacterium]MBW2395951.1 amidase [Deltaproteobacteria bacterium]
MRVLLEVGPPWVPQSSESPKSSNFAQEGGRSLQAEKGTLPLCDRTALELAALVHRGELSARELVSAYLGRIEARNPALNAIVTLVPERALAWAAEADEKQARGEPLGPLHGLPIAHKDLVMTAGIRSTSGSPLLAEHVPKHDDLIVTRLRAAGAITIGKTNVPEFGAGSHTFNEVFGATRNPWGTSKTCGGSSGGAAVALAAGMLPIADGSDMGGSLRNPANFCNVVGFRPSPGRVPHVPAPLGWESLSVLGPMGRTVEDTALLFSAMAGPDPRAPISLDTPGARFAEPLARDFTGVRIAFDPDLGGLPVDPRVADVLEAGLVGFSEIGCQIERAGIDWTGADEAFHTLRAWTFASGFAGLPDSAFERLKDTIQWNVRKGWALKGDDVSRAERLRTTLFQRLHTFMGEYEFLILPVNQVPPFDIDVPYPEEIAGIKMETYIDWMKSAYYVTVTGHPAISVPCGFTPEGLPVGVQIVGRHRDDFGVLQLAYAYQQATRLCDRRPARGTS